MKARLVLKLSGEVRRDMLLAQNLVNHCDYSGAAIALERSVESLRDLQEFYDEMYKEPDAPIAEGV